MIRGLKAWDVVVRGLDSAIVEGFKAELTVI